MYLIGSALATRVAGSFVLLYGQPISRVTAMRKDQVIASADDLTVVFATDPVPVPALVSDLLNAMLLSTWNLQTSAHVKNTWLFPGMKPGKHLSAAYLTQRLREAGLPVLRSRSSALQTLARE